VALYFRLSVWLEARREIEHQLGCFMQLVFKRSKKLRPLRRDENPSRDTQKYLSLRYELADF